MKTAVTSMKTPVRTLEHIVRDFIANEELAATPLELKPFHVRAGFEIAIRQAKETLKTLRSEYQTKLFGNAHAYFVNGPKDKTTEFASKVGTEAVSVDAEALYDRLATRVESTIGASREFTATQMAVLTVELRDVANELGMTGYMNAPKFQAHIALKTHDEIVAFVRGLVREAVGDSLLGTFVTKVLSDRALDARYSKVPAKVVIINATMDEIKFLAPLFRLRSSVALTPETVVNESFATNTLSSKVKA